MLDVSKLSLFIKMSCGFLVLDRLRLFGGHFDELENLENPDSSLQDPRGGKENALI
jgi:hypothetical protein